MNSQLDLDRDQARATDTASSDTTVPGRRNTSAAMTAPQQPRISGLLMRRAARDGNGLEANADTAVGAASSSTGAALPAELQTRFESSLGTDLSSVRVHTGSASVEAASAVGAKAYAIGNDIHFGAGQFDPTSHGGQHLIAHEVAHTVQQRGGSPMQQNKLEVSSPGDSFEHEADHAASAMVQGASVRVGRAGQGVARVKELGDAADRGGATMDAAMHDPAVTTMNVGNVGDKATANQMLNAIRGADADIKQGIADKQIDAGCQIANTSCEDLLSDYLESAEGQTAQISTFQGLFGLLMKDFGRLNEMNKQFDGFSLGTAKDPEAAGKHGAEQAKEIFGGDDAKKETERIEKLDPTIKTKLDGMKTRKEMLSSEGGKIIGKSNDVAAALTTLSNKQREFLARANAVTSPKAQEALHDAKERAKNDYSTAAGKVLKDALMGAVGGASGGPTAAAGKGALAGGKSIWTNIVAPKLTEALEKANIEVGVFPDNSVEADKLEQEKAIWLDVKTKASAITSQRLIVRQKGDDLGSEYTAYEQARNLYENDMILLGQQMDRTAKVGQGPMPKDPCVCDPNAKPAPAPKDKGPRYETAMQFMAEADRYTAQADIVLKQGQDELTVTKDGINSASQAHAKLVKATRSAERPSFFFTVLRIPSHRADGAEFIKLCAQRNTFTLHNGLNPSTPIDGGPNETGQVGSAEGSAGMGANGVIAESLKRVEESKAKIAAYRAQLASAIGL